MPAPVFANNDISTLASSIGSGATSLTLFSGSGTRFPNPGSNEVFALTLISATNPATMEIVWCTARSGDVCTITRAQEGTTALAWTAGDLVQNLLTAGMMKLIQQTAGVGMQVFSSGGNFTVPAGIFSISIEVWGAGGGSGGVNAGAGSGGGAAGSYSMGLFSVTPGTVYAVTIGVGGAAGGNGGQGGTTSFGALISAPGGRGSLGVSTGISAGGTTGGLGTGGQINIAGSSGGSGGSVANGSGGTLILPGQGAAAPFFGQGGYANSPTTYPGQGGGGVGNFITIVGIQGANGFCRVRW